MTTGQISSSSGEIAKPNDSESAWSGIAATNAKKQENAEIAKKQRTSDTLEVFSATSAHFCLIPLPNPPRKGEGAGKDLGLVPARGGAGKGCV